MEFKGTKGSWVFNKPIESNGWASVKLKGTAFDICTCYKGILNDDNEEIKSNAKLIAAAPELLEALKSLMKEYKEIADSGDCGWWKAEEQEIYIKSQKAIEKALK